MCYTRWNTQWRTFDSERSWSTDNLSLVTHIALYTHQEQPSLVQRHWKCSSASSLRNTSQLRRIFQTNSFEMKSWTGYSDARQIARLSVLTKTTGVTIVLEQMQLLSSIQPWKCYEAADKNFHRNWKSLRSKRFDPNKHKKRILLFGAQKNRKNTWMKKTNSWFIIKALNATTNTNYIEQQVKKVIRTK